MRSCSSEVAALRRTYPCAGHSLDYSALSCHETIALVHTNLDSSDCRLCTRCRVLECLTEDKRAAAHTRRNHASQGSKPMMGCAIARGRQVASRVITHPIRKTVQRHAMYMKHGDTRGAPSPPGSVLRTFDHIDLQSLINSISMWPALP